MDKIFVYLTQIRWQDYLDMTVVAILFYLLVMRIRGTRALQIMMGIVLLFVINFLTRWGGLYVTSWIFQYLWAAILLAIIILFQPEIRRILEEVSPLKMLTGKRKWAGPNVISEVVAAAFEMASKKIGGIIVFSRRDLLDEFIQNGVSLDGIVSSPLLQNIFFPPSPLHDGAVIVRENRVFKAACFLPLSEAAHIPQHLGSRHRAAIGLTERSDAICLVVSEERGEVSLCYKGKVRYYTNPKSTEDSLGRFLRRNGRDKQPTRWKAVFLENIWIKAFSVGFALFFWLAVSGVKTSEMSLNGVIEYIGIPKKMALATGWTGSVDLRVRGSRGLLAGISSENVRVRLDLSDIREGTNFVTVEQADIEVPPGVQITSIKPSVVKLVLERIEMRKYTVDAELVGSLSSGLTLESVSIEPPEIQIEGARSQLNKIERVATEPISLAEISDTKRFTKSVVVVPSTVILTEKGLPKVTVTIKVRKL